GHIVVGDNGTFELSGAAQNFGTIVLDQINDPASFLANGNVALSGGGSVSLSDQALNTITGFGIGATLENVDNTISASGLLGNGHLTLINGTAGTIGSSGTN